MKISGELVILYTVYQDESDMGGGYVAWYFANEYEAKDTAKGRGWYGGNASTGKCKAIKLDGPDNKYLILNSELEAKSIVLGGPEVVEEQVKKALAKLTETEKSLLGLK